MNSRLFNNFLGEKFREVLTTTFGLQNWICFRTVSQSSHNHPLTEVVALSALQRLESQQEEQPNTPVTPPNTTIDMHSCSRCDQIDRFIKVKLKGCS